MKKRYFIILLLIVLVAYIFSNQNIRIFLMDKVFIKKEIVIKDKNSYTKDIDYIFVQKTEDFFPNNKQELLNVIYTILDNGWNDFTFYCGDEYDSCLTHVENLLNDSDEISGINNIVHPYNSYNKIYFDFNSFGKINIKIDKLYSDSEILKINAKVNDVINNELEISMSDIEKIRYIHDYIARNSEYDKNRSDIITNGSNEQPIYNSNKAIGPLFEGHAICSGYSDLNYIFMTMLDIDSYKVANKTHIWNIVKLNDKWLNIDLTWDDPILAGGGNVILHDYFLIDTNSLLELDDNNHNFDTSIYIEAKPSN